MANLLSGLHIALSGLQANQEAMEIVEQNVTNANTPGYHRQEAIFASSPLPAIQSGMFHSSSNRAIGGGVSVEMIKRYSDELLDSQYRQYSGESSRWQAENNVLSQVESLMNETGDNSLLNQMNAFWSSWQTLTTGATDPSLRQDVLDKAQGLVSAINSRAQTLTATRSGQDNPILESLQEINSLAAQIADLNGQISHGLSTGGQPNDLLDKRDQLLDRLSEIGGIKSNIQPNGEVLVSVANHILVMGTTVTGLNENLGVDPTTGKVNLTWKDGTPFTPNTGELAGLIDARDTVIPQQLQGLNALATGLITSVNNLHTSGFDLNGAAGTAFFSGTDASSMQLAITDPNLIAASSSNIVQSGDSEIARQISALQNQQIFPNATPNQYYNQQLTSLGLIVSQGKSNASSAGLSQQALTAQRNSLSGVSLNEEATNLIKYQRAYQAAAKVMTTLDEMLDTIINKM